jgi:hypothetical protein
MKRNTTLLALAMSGALIAGPMSYIAPAFAGSTPAASTQTKDSVAKATASSANKQLLTTVNDAYTSMRDVRAARLALFDGNTDMAGKMTNDAIAKMKSAQASEAKWGVTSKAGKQGVTYVPFDSSIALGEDFSVTPDNAKTVSKANDQMAKGDAKGAAETLKSGDIAVSLSAALVPAKLSLTHLQDAANLIKKGSYYEANLALKGVEEGVVIDQWALNDLPQQAGNTQTSQTTTPSAKTAG